MGAYPYLQFGTFLTNHDMDRVMNLYGDDVVLAKRAAKLLLTLPGIPYIYYGEEIGMLGSKPDENIRRPMQWDATPNAGFTSGSPWNDPYPDYEDKNVEAQQQDNASLWSTYNQFISLRSEQPALRKGDYNTISTSSESIVAFLRQYENDNIVVVSNVSDEPVENLELTLTYAEMEEGSYILLDLLTGNTSSLVVNANGGFVDHNIGTIQGNQTAVFKVFESSAPTTSEVTFNVDMSEMIRWGKFDPSNEFVDMISNLNGLGAELWELTDEDADSIYTLTIEPQTIGSTIEYKYRINGTNDERTEFAESDYLRNYVVSEATNEVLDSYQPSFVLGIPKNHTANITMYPIPADKQVDFSISNTYSSQILIYTLSGKVIHTMDVEGGQASLNTSNLSDGIYLVRIRSGQFSKSMKLIVAH